MEIFLIKPLNVKNSCMNDAFLFLGERMFFYLQGTASRIERSNIETDESGMQKREWKVETTHNGATDL